MWKIRNKNGLLGKRVYLKTNKQTNHEEEDMEPWKKHCGSKIQVIFKPTMILIVKKRYISDILLFMMKQFNIDYTVLLFFQT